MQRKIQRAILSVTDKSNLLEFALKLQELGVEVLSTGGTARMLREGGVNVRDVSDFTGFPEMLDGSSGSYVVPGLLFFNSYLSRPLSMVKDAWRKAFG